MTIIGGSNSSYVNGAVYQQGLSDKIFPVGFNGNYLPLELLGLNGTDPSITIEVFEPNPNPVKGFAVDAVSGKRYWMKTITSGTLLGSQIKLKVANEGATVTNFNKVIVAESDIVGGVFSSLGRSASTGNASDGTVTSAAPATSNIFAVAMLETAADVTDSLALVELFNSNDGPGWTDNTNWNSNKVSTWTGITLKSGKVTGINLSNNNLTGTLPSSLKNLVELETLNLANNEIEGDFPGEFLALLKVTNVNIRNNDFSGIPDFTQMASLNTLNVSGNDLGFEELEPNLGIANFTYNPQDSIGTGQSVSLDAGSDITLSAFTFSPNNSYQWRKDGSVISGENNSSLEITNVRRNDVGDYYSRITNSVITDLTLVTKLNRISAEADISGDVLVSQSPLPAGEVVLLEVQDVGRYDTIEMANINQNGKYNFTDINLSDYVIIADPTEVGNPDLISTYFGDEVAWQNAETIVLNGNVNDADINVVGVVSELAGTNSITGVVEEEFTSEGRVLRRRRVRRGKVRLRRARVSGREFQEDFELVAHTETNDNGEFNFDNLPDGTYRLEVEITGLLLDETSFVQFDLSQDDPKTSNIEVIAII